MLSILYGEATINKRHFAGKNHAATCARAYYCSAHVRDLLHCYGCLFGFFSRINPEFTPNSQIDSARIMRLYIVYKIINVSGGPRRIGAVRNWICVCNYWAGLVTNPGYFLISDCHGMKAHDTPSRLFEGDVEMLVL